jgi:hypothetical protein
MALFRRNEPNAAQQTITPPTPQAGAPVLVTQTPSAPGVVPPPKAPVYTTRPPEPQRIETDQASVVAEQQNKQKSVRVAVQRTRTSAAPVALVKRPPKPVAAIAQWAPANTRPTFDPARCAQAGLLNLAWSWQRAGAPIRAIHAYMQVLSRYPGTAGAEAAVADLVELSDKLACQGQYHLALGIYDELEELL